MNWISSSAYIVAVALVKVSVLLLYLRTFTEKGLFFRITLCSILYMIAISHLIVVSLYWFKIWPFHCKWRYVTLPPDLFFSVCNLRYSDLKSWVFVSIFTVIMDLFVIILPIRAVWKLHMARRQKMAVTGLIAVGGVYDNDPYSAMMQCIGIS